jgi:hypothetical protein
MASWTFLTYHARVLLCVAHDPAMRLRDIAASLNITERSAFGIITDLVEGRLHGQGEERPPQPLPHPGTPPAARTGRRERTVGEILALLTGTDAPAT